MDNNGSTSLQLRVSFYDVDMFQIVWHGNYLKYFDLARQELFRKSGIAIPRNLEKHYIFPVIRTSVKYLFPLKFNDEFICSAQIREAKVKLVIDFEVRLLGDGRLCATGRSEHAAVRMPEMEMEFRIPEDVEKALWLSKDVK
ncbi:MAG: acyl-CoA thioesterase [Syntrophales bacterium]|jgi:acyl-CoA thioester hydrolase|nr:acyl-CoA thioesterase [Syntrophales bacterium]